MSLSTAVASVMSAVRVTFPETTSGGTCSTVCKSTFAVIESQLLPTTGLNEFVTAHKQLNYLNCCANNCHAFKTNKYCVINSAASICKSKLHYNCYWKKIL